MSDDHDDDLPAYSFNRSAMPDVAPPPAWLPGMDRDWAFGDRSGKGVRVCIVDSGVDADHSLVDCELEAAKFVTKDDDGEIVIIEDTEGDVSGHGTACAGIIRALAPEATLASVRVLGSDMTGGGFMMIEGVRWAVRQGYDVVNMSLSTTKAKFLEALHEVADEAYFASCALFASAHNMPVVSYPWRFASVVSVGSHTGQDPEEFFYNPAPPVEFNARGVNVEIAWKDHSIIRASGNSFATPTMAGHATRVLGTHPGLTPFQLKTVLMHAASNVAVPA